MANTLDKSTGPLTEDPAPLPTRDEAPEATPPTSPFLLYDFHKLVRKTRAYARLLLAHLSARALDSDPETSGKPEAHTNPLGWLPVIALIAALGLFTVGTAYNASRAGTPGAEFLYWLGLGLIFIPALSRLIFPQPSRVERVSLLYTVALCLYLTKVMLSPLRFNGYDEFLHWRSANDILSTGHLFTKNPLLPVSPFYPGLEIVTNAFSRLSGLNTLSAGFLVIGIAHLLMVLAFFLLCEQISASARLASIATIIYMTNPHYLFFDSQFAYESLALPLATFVLFAMMRYELLKQKRHWIMFAAWLVLVALILTHHATNFVFEGLFLLWAAITLFLRRGNWRRSIVFPTLLVGLALTTLTLVLIGNTVLSYFGSFFADMGSEVAQTLSSDGGSGARQLFSSAGTPTPLWERLISLGSVGLIIVAIPFFLLCFWKRYRHQSLVCVFALIVLFYPVLQVLRLTSNGAELSDRASAFIFLAISFLAAVAIVQFWPVRLLNWKQPVMLSTAILVLFMGGIILGEGIPPTFLPGPFEVSADGRSIDPEGVQAALWARSYLGPDNRMETDRVNQLLMSVYGDQYLVTKSGDKINGLTDVFFETGVDSYVTSVLQKGHIHYLVVDLRLTAGPPQDGFYFEPGEPATRLTPALLSKFDAAPQINRLFDSGHIAVYDTGDLLTAP